MTKLNSSLDEFCDRCKTVHLPNPNEPEYWPLCAECNDLHCQLTVNPPQLGQPDHSDFRGMTWGSHLPVCASCGTPSGFIHWGMTKIIVRYNGAPEEQIWEAMKTW